MADRAARRYSERLGTIGDDSLQAACDVFGLGSLAVAEPERAVLITEIESDTLIEWRRVATTRLLATTLVQVQAKECAEVPQRDMPAPP